MTHKTLVLKATLTMIMLASASVVYAASSPVTPNQTPPTTEQLLFGKWSGPIKYRLTMCDPLGECFVSRGNSGFEGLLTLGQCEGWAHKLSTDQTTYKCVEDLAKPRYRFVDPN